VKEGDNGEGEGERKVNTFQNAISGKEISKKKDALLMMPWGTLK